MRIVHVSGAALAVVLMGEPAPAQTQPATIPTVVAQATSLESGMFGKTQFFDGRTPTDWPVALVPPGAKVLGGGVVGESAMFRFQTAVFAFSGQTDPNEVLRGLLTRAGYVRSDQVSVRRAGGFVGNEPRQPGAKYCKGSTAVTFEAVDSAQAPLVMVVHVIEGELARQNCDPQAMDQMRLGREPVTVPTLTAPKGAVTYNHGSGWSGTSGNIESTLRTTLPPDSVLAHYTPQLVAGGWKPEGKPALADGIAVQRFSFREGQDAWTAALIIMVVGDLRDVRVQLMKVEGR